MEEQDGGEVLAPEPFLSYLDGGSERLLLSFALGVGVGEPQLAAIGRQAAEAFALIMQRFEGFVTLPQMLLATGAAPPLLETTGGRPRVRPAFAVFHSLPQTRVIREVSRRLGASVALTGRLLGDGDNFLIGVNLLDVERLVLLGCAQRQGPRESLPELIASVGGYLLGRFIEAPAEALEEEALRAVGTRSYRAFYNWAQVRDLERRRETGEEAKVDGRREIERLIFALVEDPMYGRALARLVEHFEALRANPTGSERALRAMARGLERVSLVRPAVGMLRAEAWRLLGERDAAREALMETITRHGGVAQAHFLMGQLEAQERPKVAARHYHQAYLLDPSRELYRRKKEAFGV